MEILVLGFIVVLFIGGGLLQAFGKQNFNMQSVVMADAAREEGEFTDDDSWELNGPRCYSPGETPILDDHN